MEKSDEKAAVPFGNRRFQKAPTYPAPPIYIGGRNLFFPVVTHHRPAFLPKPFSLWTDLVFCAAFRAHFLADSAIYLAAFRTANQFIHVWHTGPAIYLSCVLKCPTGPLKAAFILIAASTKNSF